MIGLPWAMAFVEEQQTLEMEREQRARESSGEVSVILVLADDGVRGDGGVHKMLIDFPVGLGSDSWRIDIAVRIAGESSTLAE